MATRKLFTSYILYCIYLEKIYHMTCWSHITTSIWCADSVSREIHSPVFQVMMSVMQWCLHTMDLLWEKFQWILPLYMKPVCFQSKPSVVCSVAAAIFMDFCLKKLKNQWISELCRTNPQIWNVDQLSVLITSWDINVAASTSCEKS